MYSGRKLEVAKIIKGEGGTLKRKKSGKAIDPGDIPIGPGDILPIGGMEVSKRGSCCVPD